MCESPHGIGLPIVLALLVVLSITPFSAADNLRVGSEGGEHDSIQAAIEAARPGDSVVVEEGTYRENLTINKDLTLQSEGKSKVQILGVEKGRPVVLVGPSDVEVHFLGLDFSEAKGKLCENRKGGLCPTGVSAVGKAGFSIEGSFISGCEKAGVLLRDSARGTLANSRVSDNGRHGVWLLDSSRISLKSIQLQGNRSAVTLADSSRAKLFNSKLRSNSYGLSCFGSSALEVWGSWVQTSNKDGVRAYQDARLNLRDNQIENNQERGLLLWDSVEATLENNAVVKNGVGIANYSSGTLTVGKNAITDNSVDLVGNLEGTDRGSLGKPTHQKIELPKGTYSTLQAAVDALKPGGEILLTEEVEGGAVISKQVTITARGENAGLVLSSDVRAPVLSLISGADVSLGQVTVSGSAAEGIVLGGDAKLTAEGAVVKNNQGDGIDLWGDSALISSSCKVEENAGSAIRLADMAQAEVVDARVAGNGLYGILLAGSSRAEVKNVRIANNGKDGLAILKKAQAAVDACTISGNEETGASLSSRASLELSNCEVQENRTGVQLGDNSGADLQDNLISNNEIGVKIFQPDEFKGSLTGSGNRLAKNGVAFQGVGTRTREMLTEGAKPSNG